MSDVAQGMVLCALLGASPPPGFVGPAPLAERAEDAVRKAAATAREQIAQRLIDALQPAFAPFGARHWILLSLDVVRREARVADAHGP